MGSEFDPKKLLTARLLKVVEHLQEHGRAKNDLYNGFFADLNAFSRTLPEADGARLFAIAEKWGQQIIKADTASAETLRAFANDLPIPSFNPPSNMQ